MHAYCITMGPTTDQRSCGSDASKFITGPTPMIENSLAWWGPVPNHEAQSGRDLPFLSASLLRGLHKSQSLHVLPIKAWKDPYVFPCSDKALKTPFSLPQFFSPLLSPPNKFCQKFFWLFLPTQRKARCTSEGAKNIQIFFGMVCWVGPGEKKKIGREKRVFKQGQRFFFEL